MVYHEMPRKTDIINYMKRLINPISPQDMTSEETPEASTTTKSGMPQEEFLAASKRLEKMIRAGSEAGLRAVAEQSKHPLSFEQARASMLRHGLASDVVRARRFAAENKKAAEEFCERHGISLQGLIDQLAAKNPEEWNRMLEKYEFQQKIYRPHDEYNRDKNAPEVDCIPRPGKHPLPESEEG